MAIAIPSSGRTSMGTAHRFDGRDFRFRTKDSQRIKAGASYEWECSGTGTGELGTIYQPMADRLFWIDISVQGHVGERQGVSGGVRVRSEF